MSRRYENNPQRGRGEPQPRDAGPGGNDPSGNREYRRQLRALAKKYPELRSKETQEKFSEFLSDSNNLTLETLYGMFARREGLPDPVEVEAKNRRKASKTTAKKIGRSIHDFPAGPKAVPNPLQELRVGIFREANKEGSDSARDVG